MSDCTTHRAQLLEATPNPDARMQGERGAVVTDGSRVIPGVFRQEPESPFALRPRGAGAKRGHAAALRFPPQDDARGPELAAGIGGAQGGGPAPNGVQQIADILRQI